MLEVLEQLPVDNEPKPVMPGQESKTSLDLIIESEVKCHGSVRHDRPVAARSGV